MRGLWSHFTPHPPPTARAARRHPPTSVTDLWDAIPSSSSSVLLALGLTQRRQKGWLEPFTWSAVAALPSWGTWTAHHLCCCEWPSQHKHLINPPSTSFLSPCLPSPPSGSPFSLSPLIWVAFYHVGAYPRAPAERAMQAACFSLLLLFFPFFSFIFPGLFSA